MKITGNIEISGINRVVFYKKNLFHRVITPHNSCYWYDLRRNKRLSNSTMVSIIKSVAANPARKVWVHGSSVNIERVKIKNAKVLGKIKLEEVSVNLTDTFATAPPKFTNTVSLMK